MQRRYEGGAEGHLPPPPETKFLTAQGQFFCLKKTEMPGVQFFFDATQPALGHFSVFPKEYRFFSRLIQCSHFANFSYTVRNGDYTVRTSARARRQFRAFLATRTSKTVLLASRRFKVGLTRNGNTRPRVD